MEIVIIHNIKSMRVKYSYFSILDVIHLIICIDFSNIIVYNGIVIKGKENPPNQKGRKEHEDS